MSTTRYWLSEGSVPICKKIFWRKLFVFLFQINWQGHTVLAACRLCSRQNRTKQNLAERQMLAWHQASRCTQICLVFWQITNYDILTLLCSTYSMLRFFWYSYIENHEDANELSEAEGDTKFEGRESRDHGCSALPDCEIKIILLYVNSYCLRKWSISKVIKNLQFSMLTWWHRERKICWRSLRWKGPPQRPLPWRAKCLRIQICIQSNPKNILWRKQRRNSLINVEKQTSVSGF